MVPNSDAAMPAATTPAITPFMSAISAENALMDLVLGNSASEQTPTSAVAIPNGTSNKAA